MAPKTIIKKADYDPQTGVTRYRPKLDCSDSPSMTQQHFKEEVNVNNIVRKFSETGQLPIAQTQAQYGDASELSYFDAMCLVTKAKEEFLQLPSKVRRHFENDPALYLDATGDVSRRAELVELGLIDDRPKKERKTPSRRSDDSSETPQKEEPAPPSS